MKAEAGHFSIGGQSVELRLGRTQEVDAETKANIQRLVDARDVARKAKNYQETDRIRDELAKMGVVLKDTKDGTTWEIAR